MWKNRTNDQHVHSSEVPFLQVEQLSHSFGENLALDQLQFTIQKGEVIGLVGPNGAGKSTLLQLLAGILPVQQGKILFYGTEPNKHLCIGYIPQRPSIRWNFPITVNEMVMMGRVRKIPFFRLPTSKDWSIVRQALETVQLESFASKPIDALSGGQLQRLFLARALAQEAELLLLDEPLNHLDQSSRKLFLQTLQQIHSSGTTIILALHDLIIASKYCNRVMVLNQRIFAFGTPKQVLSDTTFYQAYPTHFSSFQAFHASLLLDDSCHSLEDSDDEPVS
ncbi:MAG: metal ABC transporter ATP-binding protein [bacterium]|nr:metal ABC transporter ATP-binding protein [bacterium]